MVFTHGDLTRERGAGVQGGVAAVKRGLKISTVLILAVIVHFVMFFF